MNKNRSRDYNRKQKYKKIRQRLKKIKDLYGVIGCYTRIKENIEEFEPGKLAKSHCGYLGSGGCNQKTKIKNGHCPYRCKGSYGKAIQYNKHDKQQVQDMNQQIKDYNNGENYE